MVCFCLSLLNNNTVNYATASEHQTKTQSNRRLRRRPPLVGMGTADSHWQFRKTLGSARRQHHSLCPRQQTETHGLQQLRTDTLCLSASASLSLSPRLRFLLCTFAAPGEPPRSLCGALVAQLLFWGLRGLGSRVRGLGFGV